MAMLVPLSPTLVPSTAAPDVDHGSLTPAARPARCPSERPIKAAARTEPIANSDAFNALPDWINAARRARATT